MNPDTVLTPETLDRLNGAILVFRPSLLRAMGGLLDSTFLLGEEIRLGARCKNHDLEVWYDPLCTAFHEHETSVRQKWSADEIKLTARAAHLAALRQVVTYWRFLAHDLVLVGTFVFRCLSVCSGHHSHPVTHGSISSSVWWPFSRLQRGVITC